jgi:hypothetical protein
MLAGVAFGAAAVNALCAQRKRSDALVFLDIGEVSDATTTKEVGSSVVDRILITYNWSAKAEGP